VVQDLKKQAHLIGSDLTEIFRAPLPERWNSKPQILETRNSKDFSILFSMPHALRILDHKGNPRPGFPVLMPDSQSTMEHVRLIDYDKSLQYRIFIAGRYGPVYAADMEGRFLDGWKPWNHPNPLVSAPRHIRIGEKDFILMLDNSGTLLLTNRKGEIQSGFPYSLTGRTNQPLFVEPGLGIRNSYIYCLSELGQMEKISLEGKPASSIQLFRPEKETRFQLCPDQKQKTFSVARITGNLVTIFDQGYRPVFDFQAKSSQVLVQHFQFGASNKIYAVLDLEARECNLFNETGSRITQTPLEASQPIDVLQKPDSDSEFLILTVFENRLSLSGFSKN
jgi:hypothetical protein